MLRTLPWWAGGGVGVAALGLYLLTLHPGLPGGDSGELISVAHSLGVAHPPGYPLYTLLAKGFSELVPVGSIAWRLNLFSAVTHAVALAILVVAIARATESVLAGVLASGALAVSEPFWKYSLVAEVFALNDLMAALLLLALATWLRPRDGAPAEEAASSHWPLILMAFLVGAMMAHHHTLVLIALPAVLVSFAIAAWPKLRPVLGLGRAGRRVLSGRLCLVATGAVIVGLLPLIHLPLAARRDPVLEWDDPGSLRSFLWLLLRGDYGTFSLAPESKKLVADASHNALFLESLLPDLGWIAGGIAVVGLLRVLARRRRAWLVILGSSAFLFVLFFSRVQFPREPAVYRGVVERFYLLPHLLLAMLVGFGAAGLLLRLRERWKPAPVLLTAAAILLPLSLHFSAVPQRGNTFCRDLGEGLLASVPEGGVLFTRGDLLTNSVTYLQLVEGRRPDVTLVDQEMLTYGWYVRGLRSRHPDLLPPLDRVERLSLRDGLIGRPQTSSDGLLSLIIEGRTVRVDERLIFSVDPLDDGRVRVALARDELIGSTWQRDESRRLFHTLEGTYEIDAFLEESAPVLEEYPYSQHPSQRRQAWAPPQAADRYSGLPGSHNIHWFDHLIDRRPICLAGFKDASFQIRYRTEVVGLVAQVLPRNEALSVSEQLSHALDVLESISLQSFFRSYDPWSFEHANRHRFHGLVVQAALRLARPEGHDVPPERAGVRKVRSFLEREVARQGLGGERPPWWLETRRALGLLLAAYPPFDDPPRAAALLREYLRHAPPEAPGAEDCRAMLEYLRGQGH